MELVQFSGKINFLIEQTILEGDHDVSYMDNIYKAEAEHPSRILKQLLCTTDPYSSRNLGSIISKVNIQDDSVKHPF